MSRALRAVPAQTSDRESTTCPSLLPAEIPAGCDAAIRYIARRCGDRALAEDLTQDAMVVILSHAELRSAWRDADLIFRVSLNALNNHRRKERGRLRLLEERGDDMVATINESKFPEILLLNSLRFIYLTTPLLSITRNDVSDAEILKFSTLKGSNEALPAERTI